MNTDHAGKPAGGRVERKTRLHWVPIPLMRVSPLAQRDLSQARVDELAACFDVEQLGTPVVSHRDGYFYVIDGQHRIEALKALGYGGRQVQCWTYQNLTEADEAAMFLTLNNTLTVGAYPSSRSRSGQATPKNATSTGSSAPRD